MSAISKKTGGDLLLLRRPLVTEKSASFSTPAGEVYTFLVENHANKLSVRRAFIERYGITPVKINSILVKGKKVFTRGRVGQKSNFKKMMIHLKPGDKIEL